MANESLDPVIEKYRRELMEFSRQNPKFADPQPEMTAVQETQVETEILAEPETFEMPPQERILPPQGLVREDFPDSAVGTAREVRLKNVSVREKTAEEPADPVSADVRQQMPQAQRDDCNEKEHVYALDADKYPPYCNGEVDTFESESDFLKANPEIGYLRVQVFAANQSYPIQNATVVVSKQFGKDRHVFFTAQTDASGVMSRISLPAPDRELADSPSAMQPYATYEIAVSHPGFSPILFRNCAVFDRIETIQYAEMIPLTGEDQPDSLALQEE